ncbi:MAG: NAD(P)H-binding protein [Rhodococcus sp.]|uniref:NAD(P)-dependent oxidoreductase n=1 Tax=Rhodococcus sp. TaxID=1831 RepID=UPI0016A18629|nr:NAD(P)H-binding protein [Rhodococcus sp. (in: high G+C Gram-positive bacteria)]NLV81027.1 NAD(P)H-binding protein [Rhodococcus sp. (in: high G+C Gram-positive bacteria)]
MKILIIGATGAAGSRIATEARQRGHNVTAACRGAHRITDELQYTAALTLDASEPELVAAAAQEHDVVVAATRPAHGREDDVAATTTGVAEGARTAGRRLLVVGGAAPLLVPGTTRLALDDPKWVPTKIREIAAASNRQLEILRSTSGLDWTYLAPAAAFQPGVRTGTYRTGGSDLVIDDSGQSSISMEDYAIAMMDEVESPTTTCRVLSTGY